MDRLGNLEAFVAAADSSSFTQAAERLRISPSALGRRIAQLEEELGVQLFHRTTRVVRLTDEGRLYYERSRGALLELEQAHAAISSLRARPAGRLRVEAPTILGRHVLVPGLPSFASRYPHLEIELSLRDRPSDQVAEGIDVTIRMSELEDSSLIARKLGLTRMLLCAAPSYLARNGTPRTVAALARHERLSYAPRGGRPPPWRLRDGARVREIEPGSRIVLDDGQALVELAIGGAGIAWVCDFMMARGRAAGQLVEVLAESACEEHPIYAVSQPTRHVLPKVRAFSGFAAKELEKSRADAEKPARRRGAR